MTETVTLRLSSELVARARAEAELIGQPVEDVLADWAAERDRDHERFLSLAARWKAERLPVSSPTQLTDHPAYLEIVGMGRTAIPWLLRELRREPDHWFIALKRLAGIDPVQPASRGNLDAMAADWLAWGRQQGHRC